MSLPSSFLQQKLPLGDLLDVRAFGEVCHSFAELYRIGLKVFDDAGNKLVDVKVGNADFCGYVWSKPSGREQCIATVGRVKGEPVGDEPRATRVACFSGCEYVVQPILYEGDVLGRVVFGPFVPEALVELPAPLRAIVPGDDARKVEAFQARIRKVRPEAAEKI